MLTLPEQVLFAVVLAGSIAWFVLRAIRLARLIRLGRPDPDNRAAGLKQGIASALVDVFSQRRVFRKPWVGLFHILIVWGFFVFAVNTINHFTGAFLPGFHLLGHGVLARTYDTAADVFAVLIIAGVAGLAVRRYVLKPRNLTPRSVESAVVFLFIGGAMAAYLFAHGTMISVGALDNADAYPVSTAMSHLFTGLSDTPRALLAHGAWWCGALMHLVLVGLIVFPTKHLHLVAGPINLSFPATRPRGHMRAMDLEDENAESFGVSRIDQFTWKQNLDLFACIECGRCQDYCPTSITEKPLRPKHLIVDLKHHLLEAGPALLEAKAKGEAGEPPALAGGVIDPDAIWACTTCLACVEHCPMAIEHPDKLTDLRRYLTLMESATPEPAQTAFRNMENAGNPWGFAPSERGKWAEGLDVPVMSEKGEADVLYWVGCSGSYDDRAKEISQAVVRILKAAGVDFAILGAEERCTCESARRLGNEYLYQTAAQENVETLARYKFKRILATCPHCFNTLRNEYPDFGAAYEVVHHAQLIGELVAAGKLRLRAGAAQTVAYHDSCYIGRYHGIYDAPRAAIAATGAQLVSVPRERAHGLCCGAGGGRMWLEETQGEKINSVRARELTATGADRIATACPFCMTMISDGVKKESGDPVAVQDIAELVAASLEPAVPGTA